MKFPRLLLALATVVSVAWPSMAARAETAPSLPNLVSFGAGWFDVTPNTPRKQAIEFRLEHRWGASLLPMTSDYFTSWNSWLQIHPFAGLQTTTHAYLYGFGGFVFDFLIGDHWVISPNVAVGAYDRGNGKNLGCRVEFRSTMEAGYRFENEMRVTAYFGHTSNARMTHLNPGVNSLGLYVHVPTSVIFGL